MRLLGRCPLKAPEHESEARLSILIKAELKRGRSYLGREKGRDGTALMRFPTSRAHVEPACLVPEREAGMR